LIAPSPEQIRQTRRASGLSQAKAAALIDCSLGAWAKWENGQRAMHSAFWRLFLIEVDRFNSRGVDL